MGDVVKSATTNRLAGAISTGAAARLRDHFPALQQTAADGTPFIYLDGPGGTQVPRSVIDAMEDYFVHANANRGGAFATSRRNEEIISSAREKAASFVNAASAREIVFGANMTTLTLGFSRILARTLQPGDEIIVTRLDHDANISPWLALQEQGVVIRWLNFNKDDCTLCIEQLEVLLNERTRIVAVGYASNVVGTINPVREIAAMAHKFDALVWVDAVHYAAHGLLDVQALDCDFLVCSVYKFFGPHVGMLWAREDLLQQLQPYRVRPASNAVPDRFETGTANQEGLAGTAAAIDYIAAIAGIVSGARGGDDGSVNLRTQIESSMGLVTVAERALLDYLIDGLARFKNIRIHGLTGPSSRDRRTPTVSFTHESIHVTEIARQLAGKSIFVWAGNHYALSLCEDLGVEETGGVLRIGISHYNTQSELDRLLQELETLL